MLQVLDAKYDHSIYLIDDTIIQKASKTYRLLAHGNKRYRFVSVVSIGCKIIRMSDETECFAYYGWYITFYF